MTNHHPAQSAERDSKMDRKKVAEIVRRMAVRNDNSGLADAATIIEQQAAELASMTRLFHAARADLGVISEALGLDPNDGAAEPIIDAIEQQAAELEQARATIARQAAAARMGMDAAKASAAHMLEQAEQARAASSPDALASERAANALLTEQRERQAAELAVLRKDAERVEWMEEQVVDVSARINRDGFTIDSNSPGYEVSMVNGNGNHQVLGVGDTLRAAIDAAMQGSRG